MAAQKLPDAALAELTAAKRQLESTNLAIRMADKLGTPIEKGLAMLPAAAADLVNDAVRAAIAKALDIAINSLDSEPASGEQPKNRLHRWLAAGSGAVGGAFGFAGFAVELPVSTGVILRSIAEIAKSYGEDLNDPAVRLACIEVFAYGGPKGNDDASETGYFAMRQVLAASVSQAASHIAKHGLSSSGAPALARFISAIAARFSLTAGEKLAAQLVPVAGAVGGAVINTMFIEHYQKIAAGHFAVRRLERQFGAEKVRAAYEQIALPADGTKSKQPLQCSDSHRQSVDCI